ncbi:MAG TPA: 50S ribosomal protein L9 [Candidatus Paceibacterota bacterium]|jgi:large subunit ribosomal protein L9|nr:50S ribosomal protein L9 [Candidatus Paceibacterota bacterium]
MKVILLKDVRGCGQANTIVDVAQGYAVNFLLPHKYAIAATEEKAKEMEEKKSQLEAAKAKEEEQLTNKIKSLEGKQVAIAARATEKGGLFKAITVADISKSIRAEHSLEIPESAIELSAPIKTVGEHKLRLVSKSAKANFTIVVSAQ